MPEKNRTEFICFDFDNAAMIMFKQAPMFFKNSQKLQNICMIKFKNDNSLEHFLTRPFVGNWK